MKMDQEIDEGDMGRGCMTGYQCLKEPSSDVTVQLGNLVTQTTWWKHSS